MEYGVSLLPVVPVRSGPSEKNEMITQLLFGEYCRILEKQGKWYHVEIVDDGYQGWLTGHMTTSVPEEHALKMTGMEASITANPILPVNAKDAVYPLMIPAGSSLYEYKPASNSFITGEAIFRCGQQPDFHTHENIREEISDAARRFLNIPYLWGGKNAFGIDCSGLTQVIMKIFGVKIPRDASRQVELGTPVNFINEAKPGDLAYFDNEEGEIIHTGVIINNQQIIHASGYVRIDRIDHQGIYNSSLKQYTHRLRVIKNLTGLL